MASGNGQELGVTQKIETLWDEYLERHDIITHDYVCNYLQCGDNLSKAKELTGSYGVKSSKLIAHYLDQIAEILGDTKYAKIMHETFCKCLDSINQRINENN